MPELFLLVFICSVSIDFYRIGSILSNDCKHNIKLKLFKCIDTKLSINVDKVNFRKILSCYHRNVCSIFIFTWILYGIDLDYAKIYHLYRNSVHCGFIELYCRNFCFCSSMVTNGIIFRCNINLCYSCNIKFPSYSNRNSLPIKSKLIYKIM